MKKLSFVAATVSLCLYGCSFNEDGLKPDSSPSAPYQVRIYGDISQQPATKVVEDGFTIGDEVGVYIVNYDGDIPGTLQLTGNQADNIRFKYTAGGNWVPDSEIYYRDNETKVDFYGYYPYSELTSINAFQHEVARNQNKDAEYDEMAAYEASDFLWAKAANVTPTDSKVLLTFRHIMSSARIRFTQGTGWENAEEYASATKEVLVSSTVRTSTIDLATGTVTPVGDAPLTGIVPMNDHGEFRAIVVPQTVEAGNTLLTITINGKARNFVRDVETEYIQGKITTYNLAINKVTDQGDYEIEVMGVNITAWEADNVSHGDDAREYVVVHCEAPGDLEMTMLNRLEMDPDKIKNLKLTGRITASDYYFMRDKLPMLQRLNLKEVESIVEDKFVIPKSAFSDKKSLIKCILPDKLEKIDFSAFNNTSLTGTLILPEGLKSVSGFANTNITNVQFPSTLEEIEVDAFYGCRSLMCELSFPENVKKIGDAAFINSAIRGNLILPDNLEAIGEMAFLGCRNLTGSLTIPSKVKYIKDHAFAYCENLNGTLSLPENLLEIGQYAFSYAGLKGELVIPQSVYTIGVGAFQFSNFSGTLKLPGELAALGADAFYACHRLSGIVEIPSAIVSIPENVFAGCSNLEGVIINKNVEVIGAAAFENCVYLSSVVCNAKTPPTIHSDCFNGVAKDNFTLEVPEASVNMYRNANYWSDFKRIEAHRDFSISRNLLRSLNAPLSKELVVRAPSEGSWSVQSKPDWVEVNPMSGVGKTDVVVTTSSMSKGSDSRYGEVVFLLDGKDYTSTLTVEQYDYTYGEGDYATLQTAGKGNGVNIVLLGDCFDAKDISEGHYLKAMEDAYEYFFDIEPFNTYKDYFNVYCVFGLSADSGMGSVNTIRESRFGSQYTLADGVTPDFDETFSAACLAPINNEISSSLVIMIENSSEYAGLTYMWEDGSAVAVVPMSTDPAPYDFRGLVHHEAGGHGFGKLADEYIYHIAFIQSCGCQCCRHEDYVLFMQSFGFFENISLSGNMKEVPWSHLIYDPKYSNTVDVYEGAYFHSRGVFRSEPSSCMNNNIPYYSAISRESMVKRIMRYAGETYSFESFKALDRTSTSLSTKSAASANDDKHSVVRGYQYPPKWMGEKPTFRKQ